MLFATDYCVNVLQHSYGSVIIRFIPFWAFGRPAQWQLSRTKQQNERKKCHWETDKQTVYIYNREQVQKRLYDWVCEKSPVTKVTGVDFEMLHNKYY